MSLVILDAMENDSRISSTLKSVLEEGGEEISYFKLKDMNILPCRSCGSCSFKSPGKCVFYDDAQEILRAIAASNRLLMLTPIRFGGYSSCLKKAVDKFMLLILPTYTVKQGHLLHPPRYGSKKLLAIGVEEKLSIEQEESFRRLVENNALNMQAAYKTLILRGLDNTEGIKRDINSLLEEA